MNLNSEDRFTVEQIEKMKLKGIDVVFDPFCPANAPDYSDGLLGWFQRLVRWPVGKKSYAFIIERPDGRKLVIMPAKYKPDSGDN